MECTTNLKEAMTSTTIQRKSSKPKTVTDRYLIYDISLTSPGFAVIDVTERKPTLITTAHATTDAGQPDGQRFAIVEAFAITTASAYGTVKSGTVTVIREDYMNPRQKRQGQTIFGAWAAVDSGLRRCGLTVSAEINATTVKRVVGGHGKADKDEVAAGVKRILSLPESYMFATNDESDSVGIGLTYLIEKGLIDV